MKFGLALAAALAFGTLGMGATVASAAGSKSTMETGSNATDAGGGMSGGKMSGGKMQKKSMKKKKM